MVVSGVGVLFVLVFVVVVSLGMLFMMVIVVVVKGDRVDALGGNNPQAVEIGGLYQPLEPSFELQSVHEQDVGLADHPCLPRGGLVDMGVAVWTDERRHRDMFAADALHHVAENREGGDDRDGFVRLRDGRCSQRQGHKCCCGFQKGSAVCHGISFQNSRWRRGGIRATRLPVGPNTRDIP